MKIIGLMSGTSLDGCDVALAEINDNKYELIDYLLFLSLDNWINNIYLKILCFQLLILHNGH